MSKERAYIDIDWIILMMCLHLRWCNDNKLLVTISTMNIYAFKLATKPSPAERLQETFLCDQFSQHQ